MGKFRNRAAAQRKQAAEHNIKLGRRERCKSQKKELKMRRRTNVSIL